MIALTLALSCALAALPVSSPAPAQEKHVACVDTRQGSLCSTSGHDGETTWQLRRSDGDSRKIAGPETSLVFVSEMSVSPSGAFLASISVGEGHPIVDVFELEDVLGGESTPPLVSINPYPGTIGIVTWEGDTLVLESDVSLTAPENERMETMRDEPVEFAVELPSGRILERPGSATVTLEGTLREKPWSKTEESWNAGGSEYYVLDVGETPLPPGRRTAAEGVLLRPSDSVTLAHLREKAGRRVVVKGSFVDGEVVAADASSAEPRPVTPSFPGAQPQRRGAGFRVVELRLAP